MDKPQNNIINTNSNEKIPNSKIKKSSSKNSLNNSFNSTLSNSSENSKKSFSIEGIISQESLMNKYEIISYSTLKNFPFCLVGRIISKFLISNTIKYQYGVGILIGPRIVLTVAHNLIYKGIKAKKIFFNPISNGDFNLCNNILSYKCYIPEDYISYYKLKMEKEQLLNDWGLIFFNWDVGEFVINNINAFQNDFYGFLKENDGVYQYFINELNNNDYLYDDNNEISIIGYTEYNEAIKIYKNSHNDKIKYKNRKKSTIVMRKYKFERNFSNQGKIFAELIQDIKNKKLSDSMDENNIFNNLDNDININNNETILISEYLNKSFNTDKIFQNNINDKIYNTDFILFNYPNELNSFYHNFPNNNLVMTESKGKLLSIISEKMNNIIKYRISTYKGQSGSPIFLRDNNNIYHFIGLHSRRGPIINVLKIIKLISINIENYKHKSFSYLSKKNNSNKISVNNIFSDNHFQLNGICNFNIALGLNKNKMKEIIDYCKTEIISNNLKKYESICFYYNISLVIPDVNIFIHGLFKPFLKLEIIFKIVSKCLKLSKKYILIQDNFHMIYNYNIDRNRNLEEIFSNYPVLNKNVIFYQKIFQIKINYKLFSEQTSNLIIEKICKENNITIKQIQGNLYTYKNKLLTELINILKQFNHTSKIYNELLRRVKNKLLIQLNNNIDDCIF